MIFTFHHLIAYFTQAFCRYVNFVCIWTKIGFMTIKIMDRSNISWKYFDLNELHLFLLFLSLCVINKILLNCLSINYKNKKIIQSEIALLFFYYIGSYFNSLYAYSLWLRDEFQKYIDFNSRYNNPIAYQLQLHFEANWTFA